MLINYKSKKMEKLCTDKKHALKSLEKKVVDKLFSIIEFIKNSMDLNDIKMYPPYKFHALSGNRENQWSIYIGNTGYRLIIIPQDDDNNCIKKSDVIPNCKNIKVILIEEVNNHYE